MRNDIKRPLEGNLIQEHPDSDNPVRFGWLRSRWAIVISFVVLAALLVIFGNGNSQASLGQSVQAFRQQKDLLSPQEYQFTGQGELTAGSAETWVVGGVPVVIGDQTQSEGKIHPGDSVSLVGHILEDGSWLAERVVPISEQESYFSFAGPLEAKGKNSWQVAGVILTLDKHTQLGKAIPEGELVLATFQVQPNGSWLALQIQALSALEKERTPTITPTATPAPTPKTRPTIQDTSSDQGSSRQTGLVTICHKPNKKRGGQTLVVEPSALNGHLKHGDTLGACH